MKNLRLRIEELIDSFDGDKNIIEMIKNDKSVSPFCTENRLLAYFLSIGKLSFDSYSLLCKDYFESNQYLYLFDMAPRTFGETWGEEHIMELFPEFVKATRENLATCYPQFDGEFDLWIDGIRVEVKACRANSTASQGSLSSRAYSHDEANDANFKYHYQQLKPSCCDVFIWIGVCRDELIYWVLTSEELQQTGKLGPQHRNEKTGVEGAGVFEGQVFMTEEELKPFLVTKENILIKVREKATKKT